MFSWWQACWNVEGELIFLRKDRKTRQLEGCVPLQLIAIVKRVPRLLTFLRVPKPSPLLISIQGLTITRLIFEMLHLLWVGCGCVLHNLYPRTKTEKANSIWNTASCLSRDINYKWTQWFSVLLFKDGTCHTHMSLVKASLMVTLDSPGPRWRILPPQREALQRKAPQYLVNNNIIHHILFCGYQTCSRLPFPHEKTLTPPPRRWPKTPRQVLIWAQSPECPWQEHIYGRFWCT